ncbi:glucuronide transporter [Escherichia coli]|uniref:glucuronide transporter n=1 Tax=Escherichia coli TaxID=562 RepID=UPI000B7EA335|nr:glucuronide transporter [Escherichia coli]EIT5442099.1 glucuronide transporter [Salmonella enterica]EKP6378595.1 glucuronide transporter [Salmonella enterica subsp. enterica serovar Anatum]EEV5623193.1 glucuronide transporter [Escherichia coli]EEY3565336.1 glucuronide transporter [Escherichia coli]EEY3573431.1 glucuronide transporter [Escherichia coli]
MENNGLSLKSVIGYGLGDVANNFAFAMGALFLLNYYTDVAGIEVAAAGTMLLLVRVFDAFADIVVGRLVDRVNTRWGKFRPFLLFGSVPLMGFSVLCFLVPSEWQHSDRLIYAYLTYMGLGVCYSLVNIPYGSLATVMTQESQLRAQLGAARSIGGALSFALLAFIIGPRITSSSAEMMQSVYTFWTIFFACVGVILYFICFKSTRENVLRTVAQPGLRISLKTLRLNRPLMMLCCGALCLLIGSFSVSSTTMFYVRYVLNDSNMFSVIVGIQMILGVCSAPLVPYLVKKYGKKKTFQMGTCTSILGFIIFFFATSGTSVVFILFSFIIASAGVSVAMTVMWALEADTVEYGEYLTGVRIEGLTYSVFSFIRKCGQAIGGSIPAFVLGVSGYIANQIQTPEAIIAIRLCISVIPALFLGGAFTLFLFYPLTDEYFNEIMRSIKEQRNNINDSLL